MSVMAEKGDLWHQLAHILDPRDPDDPPRPYAPILIEAVDQLEKFFSDFAERWRRGADKEICEMQSFYGLKMADLRAEITQLKLQLEEAKAYNEANASYIENLEVEHNRKMTELRNNYAEKAGELHAELIDLTARSVIGRAEAWGLIDRLIFILPGLDWGPYQQDVAALLAEIEEKRGPRDVEGG